MSPVARGLTCQVEVFPFVRRTTPHSEILYKIIIEIDVTSVSCSTRNRDLPITKNVETMEVKVKKREDLMCTEFPSIWMEIILSE